MNGPLSAYRDRLSQGLLHRDSAQAMAVEKLQSLHNALMNYRPSTGEVGWLARFGLRPRTPQHLQWNAGDCTTLQPKQGLYIYGEVGRGKSMLMDLFFETAPVAAKRRVHFHEFMRDVHDNIHQWRQSADAKGKDSDPIPRLAAAIAAEAWLLCFDELQVSDIGDAMILGRLFQNLFDLGVVIVITSNRPPNDLYKDGLQRERFLPFIAAIKTRLDILGLNSQHDYRLGRKKGIEVYYSPLGDQSEAQLTRCFDRLTGGQPPTTDTIVVHGRAWQVPKSADGVAWFDFADLCQTAMGASDYLELATQYHTVLLSNVPTLSPANRDAAKRFVTLIDALYEHKTTFLCSAESPPQTLYPTGDGSFEFQRTVSRLMEMQSQDYLSKSHLT